MKPTYACDGVGQLAAWSLVGGEGDDVITRLRDRDMHVVIDKPKREMGCMGLIIHYLIRKLLIQSSVSMQQYYRKCLVNTVTGYGKVNARELT